MTTVRDAYAQLCTRFPAHARAISAVEVETDMSAYALASEAWWWPIFSVALSERDTEVVAHCLDVLEHWLDTGEPVLVDALSIRVVGHLAPWRHEYGRQMGARTLQELSLHDGQ